MPSFSEIAESIMLPACCMLKNPTAIQRMQDDVYMLGGSFATYLLAYLLGFHSLCLLSLVSMNLLTFQVGMNYHALNIKKIHLNHFDELDESMSSEDSDELSLKQRDQGATVANPVSEDKEDKVYRQLEQVVNETNLRNRKRREVDYSDMPSLISASELYASRSHWNYSQNHYLHSLSDLD